MCITVTNLWKNCHECSSLIDEIVKRLEIKKDSSDYKALLEVFDFIEKYIKKLPENKKKRKNWEPYIIHLIHTTRLLFEVTDNLSLEQVVVALLHDFIEDIDDVCVNMIAREFWHKIAFWVKKLSKDSVEQKQTKFETDAEKWLININYIKSLEDLDDFELNVKFSDRIHNLRTLYWLPLSFIEKTLNETIDYYIPLAYKRNKKAWELIVVEVFKLTDYLTSEKVRKCL